jgi:hypothetical protein
LPLSKNYTSGTRPVHTEFFKLKVQFHHFTKLTMQVAQQWLAASPFNLGIKQVHFLISHEFWPQLRSHFGYCSVKYPVSVDPQPWDNSDIQRLVAMTTILLPRVKAKSCIVYLRLQDREYVLLRNFVVLANRWVSLTCIGGGSGLFPFLGVANTPCPIDGNDIYPADTDTHADADVDMDMDMDDGIGARAHEAAAVDAQSHYKIPPQDPQTRTA